MKTTGAILTQLRKERDVGQKEIAAYLKVSIGTVSNYENDVHAPDYAALRRLADYFDVTTDYLLGRSLYRGSTQVFNRRLSDEYTVADVINLVIEFDSGTVNHLMEYAKFLCTQKNA